MIRVIRKFGKLLDFKQKKHIVMLLFMMVIGAFLEVMSISLLLPLISAMMQPDIIETNKFVNFFCSIFGIADNRQLLIVCLISLIFIFILKNVYLIIEYCFQYRFIYNGRFETQRRIMDVYLHRSYEFFLSANSGEIIRVLNIDVSNSYNLLATLLSIATESIVSLALIVAVLVIDPTVTIVTSLILLSTIFVITWLIKPQLRKAGIQSQTAHAAVNKWLLQFINGIKEIKVSQTEEYFRRNYEKSGCILIKSDQKYSVFQSIPRMLIEMTTTCGAILVITCMAIAGADIQTLIPVLSAFVMAALKLLPSANRIASGINQIAFREPGLDQLLEKIDILEQEDQEAFESKKLIIARQVEKKEETRNLVNNCMAKDEIMVWPLPCREIQLLDIVYSYPNVNKPVFSHADMIIPIGSSVGIIGASGAGKTTIVDILLGLLNVQNGKILCDGVDVQTNYQGWLSHVGYIPQMIFMLDDTIRANIAFGSEESEIDDKRVWEAVEKTQLAEFIKSLPEGLNTEIGERGIRISGGQRQRIGIARALYTNSEILIFDEATSALDNETEAAVMEAINALYGQKTLIIIAHRMSTIDGCDIVYRVDDGKIIQEYRA